MIKKEYPTTVADIMTTDVTTVNPHQTLADALALLRIHLFHHLLVVDSKEKLVGVLSDRDLLGAVALAT
jgi:CBS domain-containing protein